MAFEYSSQRARCEPCYCQWLEGNPERLPALIAELVDAKVDVILLSGTPAIRAAQKVTRTIPVVFIVLTDPVTLGFVPSLAHPGGNMTGVASQFEELITKQLQLLKEAVPNLSRVGLLHQSGLPPVVLAAAETAARSLGLTTRPLNVTGGAEFDNAFKLADHLLAPLLSGKCYADSFSSSQTLISD